MTNRPLVAVDDGYAQIKIATDNPDGGAPLTYRYRTAIRSGRFALGAIDGQAVGSYRTEEDLDFTISDSVSTENTQFDSFHTSPMNRVLVHHGLSLAGFDGKEVDLITGLPVADYFFGQGIDEDKIEAKRRNLLKGVERRPGGTLAKVSDVSVGCQAVASFFDFVLDDNLEYREDANQRVAIVDVGGRTTDIAVIVGGREIDHSQSGTKNAGVLDVYNALRDSLRQRFKIKDDIPISDLDTAVRTGSIKLWGEQQDVKDLIDLALADIESKIAREVERQLGSGASLDAVVCVGGGGALFKNIHSHFRNGRLAENPEFSNARGLWKFASLKRKLTA